jgi:two-component system sensor histidine kinase TctE
VTHQLLGQAMISYRKDTMPRERIQAVELARGVLRDAVPHSLDRDITVELHSEAEDLVVEGDRLSLHEGLSNLVNNAITHGAPSALRIHVSDLDGQVQVTVGDDGTGIAPQKWDLARLPFGLPREEGSGAGLGISIASEIAAAHGGTLSFAFAADGFFEVRLILPRCL